MKIKRLLPLFSGGAILLGACTETLDYHRTDIPPQLNMNAQLKVGDTLHLVHLCISTDKTIQEIRSGTVRCLVNGTLAATAKPVDAENHVTKILDNSFEGGRNNTPKQLLQQSYGFQADFKEGDIVRIEAEADGFSAWSEVIVPKAPRFEIADTMSSVDPSHTIVTDDEVLPSKTLKIRLKGTDDVPGKNYYRLWGMLQSDQVFHYSVEEFDPETSQMKETAAQKRCFYANGIKLWWGNDPILSDGAPAEDLDLFGARENYYNAFSDNLFSGGTFELGFMVHKEYLGYADPEVFYRQQPDGQFFYPDSVFVRNRLEICLSAITETDYDMLKALSLHKYNDEDISFFTEPITFPDNVEGGVGVVSVENPTRKPIPIKEVMLRFGKTYMQGE